MATKEPQVGDAVMWHGKLHKITGLPLRAVMRNGEAVAVPMIVFENKNYRSICNLPDFAWSQDDDAWFGAGRVLSRDERILYEALIGARPPAETHMVARRILDSTDYDTEVPRERLAEIIASRKSLNADDAEAYVDACLAHCAELKEARNG